MTIVADSWNTVSHYYLFSLPLFIMKTHSALTILCLLCTIHCAAAPQKAVSDTLLSARFNRYARENPIEKLYLHQKTVPTIMPEKPFGLKCIKHSLPQQPKPAGLYT